MANNPLRKKQQSGFTLIELMIVVAIIGILASTAIPLFGRYQLRTKSSEAKTNLSAIRVVEETRFSETGAYFAAAAEPAVIPGSVQADFDDVGSDFVALGWNPEGRVYFSYAVTVSPDATGYTADAAADIDQDGILQIWGYTAPDANGDVFAGGLGCDASAITPKLLESCIADSTIF
ncbi:MAG: type IV pilin protein [Myxococcota bacterium]